MRGDVVDEHSGILTPVDGSPTFFLSLCPVSLNYCPKVLKNFQKYQPRQPLYPRGSVFQGWRVADTSHRTRIMDSG